MKLHTLKIKSQYFLEVWQGFKTFELRKNDRDYEVGDLIHFIDAEDGEEFPFEDVIYKITYILKDVPEYGLKKGYCILGIKKLVEEKQ